MDEPAIVNKPLRSTHSLFIDAYILSKNATKAAIAAGYSTHSASKAGYRLVHDPRIKAEIERRIADERAGIAARQARKERIAFSKEDAIDESLKLYKEADEPRDKTRALELASKLQGFLSSDVNVNLNLGLFQNAAQELSSITSDHNAIRAELAPPAQELPKLNAPESHSDKSAEVK